MSLSVTMAATRSRIRKAADIETNAESTSVCPDAELDEYINDAYRELYDILVEVSGPERFAVSASLASPYTLPSALLEVLGVSIPASGGTPEVPLHPFAFGERGVAFDAARPRYRVSGGSILLSPSSYTASLTLWYIPVPSTLASGGSFDSIDGWDTYVVAYGALQVRIKQEYDTSDFEKALMRAERRVRRAAKRLRPTPSAIVDMRSLPDAYYFNS